MSLSTTSIFVQSKQGNVGIGVTNPQYSLHTNCDTLVGSMRLQPFNQVENLLSTWYTQVAPSQNWISVCWSPELSLFCAVSTDATGNDIMTSSDGSTWNVITLPIQQRWGGVCWSSGLYIFCAISYDGAPIVTSSDGITWITRSGVSNTWRSICWSPELSLFCSVADTGTGNRVMTSSDGITWISRTTPADNGWLSICWAPEISLFCAVSYNGTGNRVMTSSNGITWVTRSSAANNNWCSVCWSPQLNLFCAVGYTGSGNRIMTSSNGITWISRTSPINNNWRGVCWAPELYNFCAVAVTGTGNRLMTSSDGINWVTRASPVDNSWYSICWSPQLKKMCTVATYPGTLATINNQAMTSGTLVTETTPTLITLDNKGYIGIGTTITQNKLHINNNVTATNTTISSTGLLQINNTITGMYKYCIMEHQEAKGIDYPSGTPAGTWYTRVLNTQVADTIGIALDTGTYQFTFLYAGIYEISVYAVGYNIGRNRIRLYNVTTSTTDAIGTSDFSTASAFGYEICTIYTILTVPANTTYQVDHFFATANTTNGFGVETNATGTTVETYVRVKIVKVGS